MIFSILCPGSMEAHIESPACSPQHTAELQGTMTSKLAVVVLNCIARNKIKGSLGAYRHQSAVQRVLLPYPSPLEETLLDFSIYGFYISLPYEVPSGLHAMYQPRHTDEGMCGHATPTPALREG